MRKSIKKIMTLVILTTTVLGTTAIPTNAEWKRDNVGWWNTEGTSYSIGWRQIDSKWYYFNANGYMETGWLSDTSGKYYYLNADGSMASNTVTPDGYTVDETGAWVSTISKVDINTNTQPTTSIQPISTNNTVVSDDNKSSTSSTSSSSSSSSSNTSTSSSSGISNSQSSKKEDLITIFYRLDDLKVTRMAEGIQSLKSYYADDLSKKAEVEATYGMIIVNAKNYNITGRQLMDSTMVDNNYNIKNDNGTISLVKKTVSEETTNPIPEPPVIEPVDPVITSPSAVTIC